MLTKKRILFTVLFFLIGTVKSLGQTKTVSDIGLIPYPQSVFTSNETYTINANNISYFSSDDHYFNNEIKYLTKTLFENYIVRKANSDKASIQLLQNNSIKEEGYFLTITNKGIKVEAGTISGMFYGLQTLKQLIKLSQTESISLPCVTIKDNPAFEWRGAQLDVARHFFSKEYLLKFIDLLSFYKFNKLHLHLTDDQGWRLEIKRYPKLTEEGAWRTFNDQDSVCMEKAKNNPDFALPEEFIRIKNGKTEYGGFYTQDDMRKIIAYATSRHIEIIPEIDMPGHMMIAAKAYPELLDKTGAGWGQLFSVPLCVCKDDTYKFVEGVLSEVIDLFPSKFIHIGADEVDKSSWEKSEICKQLMQKEGIANANKLQSFFVNRINQFMQKKGKTAIGWDDVLDGGVDSSMRIMYWRGWVKDGPLKAVTNMHNVIMSPTNPLYFDYLPNKSSLAAVYEMQVVPTDIPDHLAHYIKGAQANVWSEMIPTTQRLEFMLLPRLNALAERVWTHKPLFETYQKRLIKHFSLWDKMQLHYRLPDLTGFADEQVIINGAATLHVQNPLLTAQVHYTLDGSLPTNKSPILNKDLKIAKPINIRFASITKNGTKSELYNVNFKNANWEKPLSINSVNLKSGLKVGFYNGSFSNTKAIKGDIIREEIISNVHLSDTIKLDAFGAHIRGYIKVPEKAIYNFYLICDDGGVLSIADQSVVDNDGQHAPIDKSGQIALDKGLHNFKIDFIEAGGGFTLKLMYSKNNEEMKPIPNEWFWH